MSYDRTLSAPASILRQPWQASKLLPLLLVAALASTVVHAQTATFTLQDSTNLTPGTYQIYVTGYSTAGPYVLQSDGSWGAPAAPTPPTTTATLPCYRFPQEISQVQITGALGSISARVYYFVVTDTTRSVQRAERVYLHVSRRPQSRDTVSVARHRQVHSRVGVFRDR
ncbi:MAG: hypothetical protein WBM40_08240, partial [Thiohalocapsa sp.]